MQNERVKSDVTITVFKDQTHLSVFEDDDSRNYIIKHQHGMSYDSALKEAHNEAAERGMVFIADYSEINEFGDPVTCLFFRWD